MARAYYYNMKPFFDIPTCPIENQKIRILYTDTDSLVLWIRMDDDCEVYKDFVLANKEIFDLSSYTKDHIIFSAIIAFVYSFSISIENFEGQAHILNA